VLTSLIIQDVVLIDRLEITLTKGLNVFTGETGTGKSILMDALSLALGARADANLVRSGTQRAITTAGFESPFPAELTLLLEEQGLAFEDLLILRRIVGKDGKNRAFVNDQPISVSLLKKIGGLLLEVHGQFETHGLLNPITHRSLLDSFANLGTLKKKTSAAYTLWQKAQKDHAHALKIQNQSEAEADFLRMAVAELDELAPEESEIDNLSEKRKTLQYREKILDALQNSKKALSGERGATFALAKAGKTLSRIADKAEEVDHILSIVDRAAADVDDAYRQIISFAHTIDADSQTLDTIEQRLFQLRAVSRKHNVAPENLGTLCEELRAKLNLIDDQTGELARLEKDMQQARATYQKLAQELSEKRNLGAIKMSKDVMKELPPLKFERAIFSVLCETLPEEQWKNDGMDHISFLAATNPGAPAAPLHKVASGGELSRFMLAIKVVLAKADLVETLVFDEVDSGIGGATASAVGERLVKLSENVQVLVITHSPQVAALGHHHLRTTKEVKNEKTISSVASLNAAQRLEEIARMLAGTETTDAARKAAMSLIEDSPATTKTAKRARKA